MNMQDKPINNRDKSPNSPIFSLSDESLPPYEGYADDISVDFSIEETNVNNIKSYKITITKYKIVDKPIKGFTLIELMSVIAIISILISLLLTGMSQAANSSKRVGCISNLRQMQLGAILYSGADSKGRYSDAENRWDRDLNYLLPYAGGTRNLYVCPATRNQISNTKNRAGGFIDLETMAESIKRRGTSYLLGGFMAYKTPYFTDIETREGENRVYSVLKTESSVASYVHYHTEFGLNGLQPGPSQIFLITDNTAMEQWNWPDKSDNHGVAGTSVGFLDGHGEWVPQSKYMRVCELSQDEGRSSLSTPL